MGALQPETLPAASVAVPRSSVVASCVTEMLNAKLPLPATVPVAVGEPLQSAVE